MKYLNIIGIIFLIFIFVPKEINGYKILGVFPTMAKSHYIVGLALMKGLAEKGHEVTMISAFSEKNPPKNLKFILCDSVIEQGKVFLTNLFDMRNQGVLEGFFKLYDMGIILTNITLREPKVQNLLKSNEKFDLVITEIFLNEAMLGFGHVLNAPIIGVSTFGASTWTSDLVGTPSPPSYVPIPFLGFTDRMTFFERTANLALTIFERVALEFLYLPRQEELYNLYFPDPKPKFRQIRKNVSLVLLNNHFSISYPRPYVPNMIEVGGMHVNQKTKPLSEDIKNFIESAKDGCIYFSLGSNLKSKLLPKDKLNILLNTFKSLRQKVLWKWEDKNLLGKPNNVFISDWFPQDDILAHPNVKLFITHGGLLSTTESIFHGKPIIGIPMFGDQFLNMARAVKAGFGLEIDYNTLNEKQLRESILSIINNYDKYGKNVQEVSKRYRDQLQPPLETAIYWVEYVIRHNGAPHLHSAGQDLLFIEYHNIDSFLLLLSVFLIIFYVLKLLFVRFILIFGRSVKKHNKQEKFLIDKKHQ